MLSKIVRHNRHWQRHDIRNSSFITNDIDSHFQFKLLLFFLSALFIEKMSKTKSLHCRRNILDMSERWHEFLSDFWFIVPHQNKKTINSKLHIHKITCLDELCVVILAQLVPPKTIFVVLPYSYIHYMWRNKECHCKNAKQT